MSEVRKIAIDSAALLAGRLGAIAVTIGFTIFFAHKLSRTQFATFAVFEILTEIANKISSFGLETYCLREVPGFVAKGDASKAAACIKTAVTNRFLWSLLIGFCFIVTKEQLATIFFKDVSYARVIGIIAIGVVMASVNTSMGLIANSVKAFKQVAIINFCIAITFCTASFALYHVMGFEGWVIGFSCSRIVGTILFLLLLRKWLFFSGKFYSWTKMVKTAFPFYLRGFAKFGFIRLDQVVVGIFMTPTALATYYVAKKFAFYVNILIESLGRPLLVRVSECKNAARPDISEMLRKISRYNAFLFVPICIAIATFGYPLLEAIGGKKYTDGLVVLIVLCIARMLKALAFSVYENGLFVLGEPRMTLFVDIVGCLSNLILLIVLAPYFGPLGVALSILFSTVSAQFTAQYLLSKIIDVRFDIRALRKVCIAMGGFVVAAVSAQLLYYEMYLAPIYFVGSFLVFLTIICHLIDVEDLKLIRVLVPRGEKYIVKVINFFAFRREPISQ